MKQSAFIRSRTAPRSSKNEQEKIRVIASTEISMEAIFDIIEAGIVHGCGALPLERSGGLPAGSLAGANQ